MGGQLRPVAGHVQRQVVARGLLHLGGHPPDELPVAVGGQVVLGRLAAGGLDSGLEGAEASDANAIWMNSPAICPNTSGRAW